MQLSTALHQGTRLLEDGAVPSARLTAELLLCHALGRERSWLYAHSGEPLAETAWIHYGRYLYQRLKGQPLQYITGHQEFYGRPFFVSPDVLIPRPETEHLIETALARAPEARHAIDIGCGSGAIAVTWALEKKQSVIATDISTSALVVAQENARQLGARVDFLACNLGSALPAGRFDLVMSNPPYIPDHERESLQKEVRDHEPALALFCGPTGVEIYAPLIEDAARLLRPGGMVVLEIGYQAESAVRALLGAAWSAIEVAHDLAGWPRVLSAQRTD
ncbi:MAG: peptide chain release factor N(5)-glutamine methyltransferase [Acidobacteriia bacterium]|nr:peptide chain release factor N(5)-glutamine methyltransferase [Terriglobia bacterium]